MIRFLDLNWQTAQVSSLSSAIDRVVHSGLYIGGPEVKNFESIFASKTGSINCLGVGNGLDALKLSLLAAGVGPGDEVIVPAFTFIATWLAVTSIGAKVIPVDVHPDDLSMNVQLVQNLITKKTKAIIPVFIFGKACRDTEEIIKIAHDENLFLLFDAAQSAGAQYIKDINNKNITNYAMAWSFYPGKNLGAIGDAGAVTTNCQNIAEKIDYLRNYGSKTKYIHIEKGCNSRLDPIQAAILNEKIKYLDSWNELRRKQAEIYDEISSDYVSTLIQSKYSELTNWHLYILQTSHRDELIDYLSQNEVETGIHYPIPPYLQNCYSDLKLDPLKFSVATEMSRRILSLPIGPHLKISQAKIIVDLINNFKPTISV